MNRLPTEHRMLRRHLPFVIGLVSAFVVLATATASAYFMESNSGNYALATAGSIGSPSSFTASPASSSSVSLSWAAPSNPSPTSYALSQSPGTLTGCSAAPSSATTSCVATGLTPGTSYTWTLTAVYYSWTSAPAQATAAPYSADGSGAMTVSPTTLYESSTGDVLTFSYTAATGGMSDGEVDLAVPSAWTGNGGSPPGVTNGSSGYATESGGDASLSVSGNTIEVTGVTLGSGQSLTVTFGSGGGASGVTAPSVASSPYTFAVSEKSTLGGTLTGLESPPTVTVLIPCSGTIDAQTIPGSVGVPDGQTCDLIDATVEGSVEVQSGGGLEDADSTIDGNLQADEAAWIAVYSPGTHDTVTIDGNLEVDGLAGNPPSSVTDGDPNPDNFLCNVVVTGDVQVSDDAPGAGIDIGGQDCGYPLVIDGNLDVQDNVGAVEIGPALYTGSGNSVQGNIEVQGNTGGVSMSDNNAGGNCQESDTPAASGSGNTANGGTNTCPQ